MSHHHEHPLLEARDEQCTAREVFAVIELLEPELTESFSLVIRTGHAIWTNEAGEADSIKPPDRILWCIADTFMTWRPGSNTPIAGFVTNKCPLPNTLKKPRAFLLGTFQGFRTRHLHTTNTCEQGVGTCLYPLVRALADFEIWSYDDDLGTAYPWSPRQAFRNTASELGETVRQPKTDFLTKLVAPFAIPYPMLRSSDMMNP